MADTYRAGAYHLADNAPLYQPVRQNNFTFLVDVSGNSPLARLKRVNENPDNQNSFITNAQEVLEFSVVKFTPPHFTQKEVEIKRNNSTVYFASTPEFKDGTLVINDLMSADGKSVLQAWQALSYDIETDSIPTSDKYKVNATVYEYLTDGTLIRSWAIKGCWVKGLSEDDWDNENNGKKKVTATLRYDRAIPLLEYNG